MKQNPLEREGIGKAEQTEGLEIFTISLMSGQTFSLNSSKATSPLSARYSCQKRMSGTIN